MASEQKDEGFSFQTFFHEQQQRELPFHQKPQPPTDALRPQRTQLVQPTAQPELAQKTRTDDPEQLPAWRRLPASVYIIAWIATSSAVILQVTHAEYSSNRLLSLTLSYPQNKYILSDLGFRHPVVCSS